jgi:hypothetical protein
MTWWWSPISQDASNDGRSQKMLDATVSLGSILTMLTVGGGLIATFVTMRTNVMALNVQMAGLDNEIKKISDVLVSIARQEERMTAMDQRMTTQASQIIEIRATQGRLEGGRFDQLCDHLNRLIIIMDNRPH